MDSDTVSGIRNDSVACMEDEEGSPHPVDQTVQGTRNDVLFRFLNIEAVEDDAVSDMEKANCDGNGSSFLTSGSIEEPGHPMNVVAVFGDSSGCVETTRSDTIEGSLHDVPMSDANDCIEKNESSEAEIVDHKCKAADSQLAWTTRKDFSVRF